MDKEKCLLLMVLVLLVWLPGCGKEPASEPPKAERKAAAQVVSGGTYRVPLLNNPTTLDPIYIQDDYGATIVTQLFDGLVRFSPELFVVPGLAETWSVEDGGTTYRFSLRSAKFHDGSPVTSEDVSFSLRRLLRADPEPFILPQLMKVRGAEQYRGGSSATVAGFETPDDRTFVAHLSEPYAPFLPALGMYQAKIVPHHLLSRDEKGFGLHPVGSGPFRLIRWDQDQAITLQRFDDYFAAPARLEQVVFKIYPGGKADRVLSDFLAQRLDEMPVYGSVRKQLAEHHELQRIHRPSLSLLFYGFNCQDPVLKDPRVRTALSRAIDRQALVQQVYGGQFEAAATILPPGMPGYQPQPLKPSSDGMDRAALRKLLGRSADQPVTIEIVSAVESDQAKAEMDFIGKSWAKLGVQTRRKFIPSWSEFENYLASDAVQVYRYVWFADIPDPDNILNPLFGAHSSANFMRYRNDALDREMGQALVITDSVKRAQLYREIEQRVLADAPLAPLFYLSSDRVYTPRVQGVQMSALGFAYSSLAGVYLVQPEAQ